MDDPPAFRRDKHGHAVGAYPDETDHGRFLGINPLGNATYATRMTVTLAVLGVDDTLHVPPSERGLPAEFPLAEVGLTPGEYVLYIADEAGPWRALAAYGREVVEGTDTDPSEVITDDPVGSDPDTPVRSLVDPGDEAGESGGGLRRVAMDHPERVVAAVEELFDLLLDRAAAVPDSGDASWERAAVTATVAYAIARAACEDPAAVAAHLDSLVDVLGRERAAADDPTTRHLTDTLNAVGRADPEVVAAALVRAIGSDPGTAEPALNSLYRLEHRYSTAEHPLCESGELRTAVAEAAEGSGPVAEAAMEVEMIHGFHRGSTD